MGVKRLRVLFVFCGALAGALILRNMERGFSIWVGAAGGLLISGIIVLLEVTLDNISLKETALGAIGLAFGLLLAFLISLPMTAIINEETVLNLGRLLLYFFFGYLGLMVGIKKRQEIALFDPALNAKSKILDTSVIIDGRIADIVGTGFVEGPMIIPRFVLQELQRVADSSDPIKRARGRRGLDILNMMQKKKGVDIKIFEKDFPHIPEVDEKLVELSKVLQGVVVTNDFNLNKVAELQGVKVLNVNDLANAVKSVVMPGEVMRIKVLKEGKESGQGVGYLDDGTMVIVENGRHYIGQDIDAVVTSVLQTTAGRMIFTRKADNH